MTTLPVTTLPMTSLNDRKILLEGTPNFRDLGGYEGAHGGTVKWKHLYRSGSLMNLTDDDLEQISALGLRLVCDFRRDEERDESPSRLPVENTPALLHLPMGPMRDQAPLYAHLQSPDGTPDDVFGAMVDIYKGFITAHTPEYKVFMEHVTDGGHVPLLFHCAAGKDRTGFGAAIILMALGVSREQIFADYELTNETRLMGNFAERWPDLDSPELFHTMLSAHPDYLQASFDEVDAAYGSFDRYLRDGLDVTPERQAALQEQLLD